MVLLYPLSAIRFYSYKAGFLLPRRLKLTLPTDEPLSLTADYSLALERGEGRRSAPRFQRTPVAVADAGTPPVCTAAGDTGQSAGFELQGLPYVCTGPVPRLGPVLVLGT